LILYSRRNKKQINLENVLYYFYQDCSSSCLLSTNVRIKYTKLILSVLYGRETWSLHVKKEAYFKLRMFVKRVLRRMFVFKREEII
jgi:hypothetical protein